MRCDEDQFLFLFFLRNFKDAFGDVAALTAFCRQCLAGYKVPRLFRLAETLPQTASGKIDRTQVGRLLIE